MSVFCGGMPPPLPPALRDRLWALGLALAVALAWATCTLLDLYP